MTHYVNSKRHNVLNTVHCSINERYNVLNVVHVFQIRYIVKLYRIDFGYKLYTQQMRLKQDPRALLR